MPNEKYDNIFLISLLILTIILLLLHKISFNKSLIIDVNSEFASHASTDSKVNNGQSQAKLIKKEDHFLLDCDIVTSNYSWPFCEVSFSFNTSKDGLPSTFLDLSLYDSVKISAQYLGENTSRIRFHLRTFNPVYSTLADQRTLKYNGIEYRPNKDNSPADIPLKALQVATWWLIEQEIAIEHSAPEFKQAMSLEIATGNGIPPGNYQLKIEKIEFTGKVISDKNMYALIIFMWIIAALTGLFINLKRSKVKLAKSINRTQELKKLNRLLNVETTEFKHKSERDPLTGALNRGGTEAIFTDELEILSLIFIDIDHFKMINDNYGHAVGDKVLVEFAKIINFNSRNTDFLARWGGEEFLLICPNTKLGEAFELAESLRIILSEHQWPESINLTASFGVAQKDKESIDKFIERADQALYAAKTKGRNTVIKSSGCAIDASITF